MPIFDLFSYRDSLAKGEVPDVYIYDHLPKTLRVQIVHIWNDSIGRYSAFGNGYHNNYGWTKIHDIVAKEHEVIELSRGRNAQDSCVNFLLNPETTLLHALDLIEFSFICIQAYGRLNDSERKNLGIKVTAADAINELNERFKRAGVGYRFEDGKIIRIDSELIHSEITKPALLFLQQRGFDGPRSEFLQAHTHFRNGEYKAAVTEANNAFESTLKAICDLRKLDYGPGARASDLLKLVRKYGLLPEYLDKSFDQLAATLQSGLPKVRQNAGAHGQGRERRETPEYVAAYALHLVAVNIHFLMRAHLEN